MTYLEKFREGIELTSKEVASLYYKDYNDTSVEIYDAIDGERGRWDYPHTMIFKGQGCNEYYTVTVYVDLTECQMDEFEPQRAKRVYPKRVEKTAYITESEVDGGKIDLNKVKFQYGTKVYDSLEDVIVAIHNNYSDDYAGCLFCPLDYTKCCSLYMEKLSSGEALKELNKACVIILEDQNEIQIP